MVEKGKILRKVVEKKKELRPSTGRCR